VATCITVALQQYYTEPIAINEPHRRG